MAVTTFPLLDLPRELQIQVWEHAIRDTLIPGDLTNSQFGVYYISTDIILRRKRMSRWSHAELKGTTVAYSVFHNTMQACQFSRLVALQWWKHVVAGCVDIGTASLEWRGVDEERIDELLEVERLAYTLTLDVIEAAEA